MESDPRLARQRENRDHRVPMVSLARLSLIFLRISNLTMGGGDPTMAALERELVERRRWLTPPRPSWS
jgi:chromate transport protein ChrA